MFSTRLATAVALGSALVRSGVLVAGAWLLADAVAAQAEPPAERPPNILLVVADDVGYSDLGVFGGEIRTPNIDALAADGVMFTDFYASPTCSPTRAMLLTGVDHHRAGLGIMGEFLDVTPEVQGRPGYEGHLNERVVTVATLLREAGYRTYMTGKWHLGLDAAQSPAARGFQKSFVLVDGGASHFHDAAGVLSAKPRATYREDGRRVHTLPDNFFSSAFYADRMIEYIDAGRLQGEPFFAYLAFTAPHWPLQVPDEWLDRYAGRYEAGYDVLREERLERMRALGLIDAGVQAFPRLPKVPAWSALTPTQKRVQARRMELYAAMVENLDHHFGRLLEYLERIDELDNTFILFMSDNGPEGNDMIDMMDNAYWVPATFDNRYDNMGRQGSYVWLGPAWAQVSAVPLRLYKSFPSQGGIRVPAVVRHARLARGGTRNNDVLSVLDVVPTLLAVAGVEHPGQRRAGREIFAPEGRSFLTRLNGGTKRVAAERPLVWELFGRRALQMGRWKALWLWPPYGPGAWQLYDLVSDPAELHDLGPSMPEQLEALAELWERQAHQRGVVVLERDHGYAD